MQVAAALAVHAALCVEGCGAMNTASDSSISAADIMDTAHQHASLLLQVASDCQVTSAPHSSMPSPNPRISCWGALWDRSTGLIEQHATVGMYSDCWVMLAAL